MRGNLNIKSAIGLDPQTITADADGATVKGPAIDRKGFEEALVNLQHGAVVDGATLAAKVQEADTETDGDFADITGAAFANIAGGAAVTSGIYAGRLNLAGRKRYLRVVTTVTGNTKTAEVAALVCLHQARELPVSQVNDLAFNVS
jgi:hypothetical protein